MLRENVQCEDEWLKFVLKAEKPKTKVFSVWSKCGECELGEVRWHPAWRHYCYFPITEFETVYSDRCLQSIAEFVTKKNFEHKEVMCDSSQR